MIHPRYECYIGSLMVRQISHMSDESHWSMAMWMEATALNFSFILHSHVVTDQFRVGAFGSAIEADRTRQIVRNLRAKYRDYTSAAKLEC